MFSIIFLLAAVLRLFGLSQPYQQDEYKWAQAADAASHAAQTIPHPPLALFLYHHIGSVIGYENLRVVPVFFSLILLIFLFLYLKSFFSMRAALIGALLFAATPYALLGSLQIDIDGVFLPLAALATFSGYSLWQRAKNRGEKKWGLVLMCMSLVIGFGFKLSFILVPAAFVLDLLFHNRQARAFLNRREVLVGVAVSAVILVGALAVVWNYIGFLRYVDNFVALHGRDYFEILFLTVKGVIYLSPPLFFGLLLGLLDKKIRKELSLWYFFLLANILFYFVIFDFSHRTFDRYLLFLVLPACVATAVWLERVLADVSRAKQNPLAAYLFGVFIALGSVAWYLALLPHNIIPLLPKTAFVSAVVHGHWRFLLPMTGGSGPLGFYLPVDVLALLWALAALGAFLVLLPLSLSATLRHKKLGLAFLLSGGALYSLLVGSEYLFGALYGSSGAVVSSLMQEIDKINTKEYQGSTLVRTSGIITYNDVGAYELYARSLYAGRFYPHDQFVEGNRVKFAAHPGYYLFVNMPALSTTSVYAKYFAQCRLVAGKQSGHIAGYLYDCAMADSQIITLLAR
ncbi:MAG: glycosyltransferase family 39 protein [bacterium]